ncbi:hypothetical protein [Aquibium oceanicum]|uniref:Uncharacterized protein n=1 Tax=Aquibium oceanicum TaxID=1670800 RepID=A0A1L3SXG5_9HYPH|nr:hypothetical protein [Aquibium oceanicum]APH74123.1 hypothetical protein BSQ44_24200 [Aquibium oceanicum]
MQIKIYELETDTILTRADVRKMRLPFKYGWEKYLVTGDDGVILAEARTYQQAVANRVDLQTLAA